MSEHIQSSNAKGKRRSQDPWALAFVLIGATLSWQVTHEDVDSALLVALISVVGALLGWLLSQGMARQNSIVKLFALLGFSTVIVILAAVFV